MQVRFFYESDGRCFSIMADGCACLNRVNKGCGTYRCEFYKPQGCEDWVRLDTKYMVRLYAPEELGEHRWEKLIQEPKVLSESENSQNSCGNMDTKQSVDVSTVAVRTHPM